MRRWADLEDEEARVRLPGRGARWRERGGGREVEGGREGGEEGGKGREEAGERLREHAERLEARRVGLPLASLAVDAVLAHAVLLDPPRELGLRAVALVHQRHGRAALLCRTSRSRVS